MKENLLGMSALGVALVLLIAACSLEPEPLWPLPCQILLEGSVDLIAQCASRGPDGELAVNPAVVEHVAPGEVSSFLFDDWQWYFVLASGRAAPALPYDNGADYFVEGLARTKRSGKVGFVNRNLDEAIPPVWDFAFPFEKGLAIVCDGCETQPVGEHTIRVGGRWGYIDSKGDVVVPLQYSQETLPPREQLEIVSGVAPNGA